PGVYALGSGSTRAIGAIREVVGAADLSQGIRVEVGETQVAVDVDLVAEYGSPLQDVANRVRAEVYRSVQELVGLHVIEVNVEVND
ncbi:Asp23/Gls24 family envelope stress response protein, partial [Klebsiella oxytoca]